MLTIFEGGHNILSQLSSQSAPVSDDDGSAAHLPDIHFPICRLLSSGHLIRKSSNYQPFMSPDPEFPNFSLAR